MEGMMLVAGRNPVGSASAAALAASPTSFVAEPRRRGCRVVVSAFNIRVGGKPCGTCKGKGAVECPGCKGSGKNKKNGNLFERWKCFDCQGFGLVSCPSCGKGGLTPEQRGER